MCSPWAVQDRQGRRKDDDSELGGAISGMLVYKVKTRRPFVGLFVELEYKKAGFLEGKRLGKGVTASLGLSFVE